MKKTCLFLISGILIGSNLFAQGIQQRNWSDGDSSWTKYSASSNVVVGQDIRLVPQVVSQPADSFYYILYGEDKIWPVQDFPISAAADVDVFEDKGKIYYLITDAFGRKIFEVNYTDENSPILAFTLDRGDRPLQKPADASIFYENGERKILITDNGDNRVFIIDRIGANEEWAYGDGTAGRGSNQLNGPSDAFAMPDTNLIMICDQGNSRVIQVNRDDKSVVWSYGDVDQLNPVDTELDTTNNGVLITDRNHHRVILVNLSTQAITWQFGSGIAGSSDSLLNLPVDADILPNGNILIADAGNQRLLEVNRQTDSVVWSFEHRALINISDADRLPDNRTLIIADYPPLLKNIPIWLGYKDSLFTSPPQYLERKTNFQSISWTSTTPPGTDVKIQIRSADNIVDLTSAQWRGPSDTDSFFTVPGTPVNPAYHLGHSHYQFRAFLNTETPLNTPSLSDFTLQYQYYKTTPGTITSDIITDSAGVIISSWQNLNFETIQHEANSIKVSILDAMTNEVLKEFSAEEVDTVQNQIALAIWEELRTKQAIRLRATLKTNLPSKSPVLKNWGLQWQSTMSTISEIHFVDAQEQPVNYYRASPFNPPKEPFVDQALVRLEDLNLATVQDAITLQIQALRSGDVLDVRLEKKPEGRFLLTTGVPLIIFSTSIPNNTNLEVYDRDTLVIQYTDPTNPMDTSADSILIIENSVGELNFLDINNNAVDSLSLNDSLYVQITGETDHNIDLSQDTIWVDVLNNKTGDKEMIPLLEQGDTSGVYYSGDFKSAKGLYIVHSSAGQIDDGQIQTLPGNKITVSHIDNQTLQDIVIIRQVATQDTLQKPSRIIDFAVGPNPFYANRQSNFRIRAASAIGTLNVKRVEIYNLAGMLVRTIDGNDIRFDLQYPIPRGIFAYADHWWDLKNDSGNPVSSGTYWIKMIGTLASSSSDELTAIHKMIIIR